MGCFVFFKSQKVKEQKRRNTSRKGDRKRGRKERRQEGKEEGRKKGEWDSRRKKDLNILTDTVEMKME